MTDTERQIPEGMVPYGLEHPDYPNAPKDYGGALKLRSIDDLIEDPELAGWVWEHRYGSADIIAYRPRTPAPQPESVLVPRVAGEVVTAAEYNEAFDLANEAGGNAFRAGFREGWIYAHEPDGADYDELLERFGRIVDIEPSEAWQAYRDEFFASLPLAALPVIGEPATPKAPSVADAGMREQLLRLQEAARSPAQPGGWRVWDSHFWHWLASERVSPESIEYLRFLCSNGDKVAALATSSPAPAEDRVRVLEEALRRLRLSEGCLDCNVDDDRFWRGVVAFLEEMA